MAVDPFRYVHRNAAAIIWELARRLYAITRGPAPATWPGRGWDDDGDEHGTGRALDYIAGPTVGLNLNLLEYAQHKAAGDAIAAWIIRNGAELHLRHLIWNERIYRQRYRAWGPLPGKRSGNSDWHRDHLHILLEDTTGRVPTTPLTLGGAAPVAPPGLPTTGDNPAPPTPQEEPEVTEEQMRRLLAAVADCKAKVADVQNVGFNRPGGEALANYVAGRPVFRGGRDIEWVQDTADTGTIVRDIRGQLAGILEALAALTAGTPIDLAKAFAARLTEGATP